jgi:hypothetical protein
MRTQLLPAPLKSRHCEESGTLLEKWEQLRAWLQSEIQCSRLPGNVKSPIIQKLSQMQLGNHEGLSALKSLSLHAATHGDVLLDSSFALAECKALRFYYQAA